MPSLYHLQVDVEMPDGSASVRPETVEVVQPGTVPGSRLAKSTQKLADELMRRRFKVSADTVGADPQSLGYSLQLSRRPSPRGISTPLSRPATPSSARQTI